MRNPADAGYALRTSAGFSTGTRILIGIRSVRVKNRIMLSPVCQYSASDGLMNDWPSMHTEPRGRISRYCLGLWNDQ